MPVEMKIEQVAVSGVAERSVFVLKLPQQTLSNNTVSRIVETWAKVWNHAGHGVPGLLLLPHDAELTSLTDDQLREIGLARLTEEET